MKTVNEILQVSASFLQKKNIPRPRRIAEELLAFILQIRRIDLYLQFDRPIEETELSLMREGVKRLGEEEPIEYIQGYVEFYGCKIRVDRRVLIPRPETEILVDHIAHRINGEGTLWDLCTGSGCIGIALKKKFSNLQVSLSDVSFDALAVAEENARCNGVQVDFFQGDLLTPFEGKTTDLITINPPYISMNEYFSLQSSVKNFEPKMALVGGETGVEFYERLAKNLSRFLHPGSQVFMEIGEGLGRDVKKIFTTPLWSQCQLLCDWAGKDRFFFLEKQ